MGPFPRSIPNDRTAFNTMTFYQPDDGFDACQTAIEALQQANRNAPLDLLQMAEHLSRAGAALWLALDDHRLANGINWITPGPQPSVISAVAVGVALGIMEDLVRSAAGEAAQ